MLQFWMKIWLVLLLMGAGVGEEAELGIGLGEGKAGRQGDGNAEASAKRVTVFPRGTDEVLTNPFIGMAPPALNGPYAHPHSLVYMVLTWDELEPEKGKYAFEAIERKYKLDEWYKQGKRVIIRFVMDYSTDQRHKDIPDWLYEDIGGDGIWYDESVGKGFSPNYDNPALIRLHQEAVTALGKRYNKDPRVAFIALGSLGHWGEWHTYSDDRITIPFPAMAVSDLYVNHYLEAFPDKKLLMRRPYPIAEDNGIGLYNDVFGSVRSTADFVDWFENGYLSVLAGDVRLPAMPDFWRRGPSGGEFANANQVREYVQNGRIDEVLQMAERSHVSWLGPSNLAGLTLNADEQRNLDKLLNKLGYRFRVSEASYPESVMAGETALISFTIVNDGVAPFYYDWPLEVSLVDEQGQAAVRQLLSGVVTGWLPGDNPVSLSLTVPDDLPVEGTYHLRIALLDPETQKPGIAFAMEGRQSDGSYELGSLQLRKRPALERFLEWYASYSGS